MKNIFPVRLLCPGCKKGLLAFDPATVDSVRCPECNSSYPVQNRIIDLVPEYSYQCTLAQAAMEWEPIIRLYESRLIRRSPYFAFFAGISFDNELKMVMDAAKLIGTEKLLDLACGPGNYSRPFARKLIGGKVVGLDLSMPMLNHATLKAQAEGIENLCLIHGSALDLPFPEREFDAANCCGALHLFPDLNRALSEIYRVLTPGGRFTAATFRMTGSGKLSKRVAQWRHKKVGIKQFLPGELEALFNQAGFTNIQNLHSIRYWTILSATKPD